MSIKYFAILVGAELVGLMSVALVIWWNMSYVGGIGFRPPVIAFNWHPILIVSGLIFIGGNSILSFRTLPSWNKYKVKIIHAVGNGVALFSSIFGTSAAFYFHIFNDTPIPHMYTLHSWIGAVINSLWLVNWLGGLALYLLQFGTPATRAYFLPVHVYLGTALFVLACATCLTGLTQKAFFTMDMSQYSGIRYSQRPLPGWIINVSALAITTFGAIVVFLLTRDGFKRMDTRKPEPIQEEDKKF